MARDTAVRAFGGIEQKKEECRDVLSAADVQKYERITNQRLTPECAHWVATGDIVR